MMTETMILIAAVLATTFLFLAWSKTESNDAWRHAAASEGVRVELVRALERSKKQADVHRDVAREHKKKRDMYRHQLREANRKIRDLQAELNESIRTTPSADELAQQMALPLPPHTHIVGRTLKIKTKVGG